MFSRPNASVPAGHWRGRRMYRYWTTSARFERLASKSIDRHLEIDLAVIFGRRHVASTHVDLHRRQNQTRHIEGGVALVAHFDEGVFVNACMHMHVMGALLGHCGGVAVFVAPWRLVVVTQEKACRIR